MSSEWTMAPVCSMAGLETRLSLEYRLWRGGGGGGGCSGGGSDVLANTDRLVASIRSILLYTDFSVSEGRSEKSRAEAAAAPLLLLMVLIPSSSSLGGIVE